MLAKLKYIYSRARLERARKNNRETVDNVANMRANAKAYNEFPKVAAILQNFNKRQNIASIHQSLVASEIDELIFIDDGSVDGSIETFLSLSVNKNDFIIRSNDLFEVRTYDRAIDFCRAEIVILLQDDDLPPSEPGWVTEALRYFAADSKLAVLGGFAGLKIKPDSRSDTGLAYDQIRLSAGASFQYTEAVNRAPMFLRKSAWRQLGGLDQAFAPFQCDDVDICLRAWNAGLRVGLMHTDFIRDIGVGGMRLFNGDKFHAQAAKNWAIIRERYIEQVTSGWFAQQVSAANSELGGPGSG